MKKKTDAANKALPPIKAKEDPKVKKMKVADAKALARALVNLMNKEKGKFMDL